jgi:hypothetical protein
MILMNCWTAERHKLEGLMSFLLLIISDESSLIDVKIFIGRGDAYTANDEEMVGEITSNERKLYL